MLTQYGPGDAATWGPVTSPRDPRADDCDDDETVELDDFLTDARRIVSSAQHAFDNHNLARVRELRAELRDICEEI